MADEETQIEKKRQDLARLVEFEPYSAFSRIDRDNRGFLCGREIQQFLAEQNFENVLESECNYLVKYFDSNPEVHPYSRIDYNE